MNSAAEDHPSNGNEPIHSDQQPPASSSATPGSAQSSGCVTTFLAAIALTVVVLALLPPIARTVPPDRRQEVQHEFQALSTAIEQFKKRFGVQPPSTITLFRDRERWLSPEGARSRSVLRQIWPHLNWADEAFKFLPVEEVTLNGPECLVFFLSGRFKDGRPVGFSKDPTNPFRVDNSVRDGPFFEFQGGFDGERFTGRFVDANGNRFPEYLSCHPGAKQPYLYVNLQGPIGGTVLTRSLGGYIPDIYRSTPGDQGTPWNDGTHQLICAAFDEEFGEGGFIKLEPDNFPDSNDRKFDRDNVTSFARGSLEIPPTRLQQLWKWFRRHYLKVLLGFAGIVLLFRVRRRAQV